MKQIIIFQIKDKINNKEEFFACEPSISFYFIVSKFFILFLFFNKKNLRIFEGEGEGEGDPHTLILTLTPYDLRDHLG
jgi:hypothetical protein